VSAPDSHQGHRTLWIIPQGPLRKSSYVWGEGPSQEGTLAAALHRGLLLLASNDQPLLQPSRASPHMQTLLCG
jgi:hypothetical protein